MARPDNSLLASHMAYSVAPDRDVPRFRTVERSIDNGAYRPSPDLMQDEALLKSGFKIEVQALRTIHDDEEMKKKINMTFGARLDAIDRNIDAISKPAQEIGRLKNEIVDLEAEKADLTQKNQDNLAEIARISQKTSDLTNDLSEANDEIADLRRENVDQNKQIERLKKDLEDAEDEIERLRGLPAIPPVKKPPAPPPKVGIIGLPSNDEFIRITEILATDDAYSGKELESEKPYETTLKGIVSPVVLKNKGDETDAFVELINLNINRYIAIDAAIKTVPRTADKYIDEINKNLILAYKKIARYNIAKKVPKEWADGNDIHGVLLFLLHVDYLVQFWASKGTFEFDTTVYKKAVAISRAPIITPDDKTDPLFIDVDNLLAWFTDSGLKRFDRSVKENEILAPIDKAYITSIFDEDSDNEDSYFVQFV